MERGREGARQRNEERILIEKDGREEIENEIEKNLYGMIKKRQQEKSHTVLQKSKFKKIFIHFPAPQICVHSVI